MGCVLESKQFSCGAFKLGSPQEGLSGRARMWAGVGSHGRWSEPACSVLGPAGHKLFFSNSFSCLRQLTSQSTARLQRGEGASGGLWPCRKEQGAAHTSFSSPPGLLEAGRQGARGRGTLSSEAGGQDSQRGADTSIFARRVWGRCPTHLLCGGSPGLACVPSSVEVAGTGQFLPSWLEREPSEWWRAA